jgi:micrococcal nuclease
VGSRPLIALAAAAALGVAGCGSGSNGGGATSGAQRVTETGLVRSVTDGDTLRLRDGRRVRLVQIDAPEVDECYAEEAASTLRRLLPGGARVILTRDPRLDAVDEHGRLLRYVSSGDLNVTVELVARGAAVPYFFRGARGRYADALLRAARAARGARRGLWGACAGARLDPRRGAVTGRG